MSSSWSTTTIAACAAQEPYSTQIGPFGNKIRAQIYTEAGAPVLRGVNVNTSDRFHDGDFVFVSDEYARHELNKFACRSGDVILCHKGTLGKIGIIPERTRYERYVMGNSMMKVRCDPEKLNPLFLYYWLTSAEGQHYLYSRVSQVGVPQIQRPLTTLREARLPMPPIEEQRAIAHVLGGLDDKIELNRRMHETLEELSRALFRSWFVDFDPVLARMQGRAPNGMDATTAALFPDSLVESSLGPIPDGWKVAPIGEVQPVRGGGTPSTKEPAFWDGGVHAWTSPKDLTGKGTPVLLDTPRKLTDAGLARVSSGLLPAGTLLLSSRAPIGYLAISQVPIAVNQGYIAMPPATLGSVYLLRWAEVNLDRIKQRAGGTTFPEISKKNFRPIEILVPASGPLQAFYAVADSLFQRMVVGEREIELLAATRDALLPKLISGNIRVKDAERQVEAVA